MTTGPLAVARVLGSVTMRSAAVSAREHLGDEHRCTAFTTDHGLAASEDDDVFGAAVCPHCGTNNALTGTPADFREQVMRCMTCTRVMVLDATALVAFATEVSDDE
jgi:hypothetical protein